LQRHDHDHNEGDQQINDAVRTHLLPPLGWMTVSSITAALNYNSIFISVPCNGGEGEQG
jgi:hypothetical protein